MTRLSSMPAMIGPNGPNMAPRRNPIAPARRCDAIINPANGDKIQTTIRAVSMTLLSLTTSNLTQQPQQREPDQRERIEGKVTFEAVPSQEDSPNHPADSRSTVPVISDCAAGSSRRKCVKRIASAESTGAAPKHAGRRTRGDAPSRISIVWI